jgi:hypothetical protein
VRTHTEKAQRLVELKQERDEGDALRRETRGHNRLISSYRKRFEEGDPKALLQCFCMCSQSDLPIPNWVRDALGEPFSEWLQAQDASGTERPSLDDFIFGPRAAQRARTEQARQIINEAVKLIAHYLRGDARYLAVSELITAYNQKYGTNVTAHAESIRTLYHTRKGRPPRNTQIQARLLSLLQGRLRTSGPVSGKRR